MRYSPVAKRLRHRTGISRSSLITSVLVGLFVILVIVALILSYVVTPSNQSTSTTESLYISGINLISGAASSSSINTTCSGDATLDIYVSNSSPNTIYMINMTIYASRLSTNATTLVPLSNGCLPIYEDTPTISPSSNDILIQTYPSIPIPPYTQWNVTATFSNGQIFTQPDLTSQPT